MNLGAIISPHDAWLMLRGLRTLPIRMRQIGETTERVAAYLKAHPAVRQIRYAWDADSPQIELARRQMNWGGGIFSIHLATDDITRIEQFCESLRYFKMAASWGGHESLIMPACAFYPADFTGHRTYPSDMVRLYIGLEEADALIEDLRQALEIIK